ncbi:hypothetical protein Bbelb_055320 [Branchiostoma belcheri]|nr:hypothetical protein Bbelb_055320 [Branchiostoma belcheri]
MPKTRRARKRNQSQTTDPSATEKDPPSDNEELPLAATDGEQIRTLQQQVKSLASTTEQLAKSFAAFTQRQAASGSGHPALQPAILAPGPPGAKDTLVQAIIGEDNDVLVDKDNDDSAKELGNGNKKTSDGKNKSHSSKTIPQAPTLHDPPLASQTGIHVPLDSGVPAHLKDKIWNHKYIDFKQLLPTFRRDPHYTVSLTDNLTPTLTIANRPPAQDSKRDLTIDQWTSAFLVFHFIYIQQHPDHSSHLVSYLHLIRDLAARKARWFRYDEQFRHHREGSPDTPWNTPHLQLYVDALTTPSPDQARASQPSLPTRRGNAPQAKSRDVPSGYCFRFHTPDDMCFKSACHYKHTCYRCGDAHKAFQCKGKSTPAVANPSRR